MKDDKKFFLGTLGLFLAVAAIGVGFTIVLSRGLQKASESLEADCHEKCEGGGQEVASFTAYGCECRDKAGE